MAGISFDLLLDLTKTVVAMAMNVKANKERCQRVAKRVMNLQELVLKLKDRDPRQISQVVRNALQQLSATLVNARDMMRKYHQSNVVKSFILGSAQEGEFSKINERLDDAYQILSGAMQIQQLDMLSEVLGAVTGKTGIRQPAPYPMGFSNMSVPSPLPGPAVQMPTPSCPVQNPSPVSPVSPVPSLTSPAKPLPKIVPAISVTPAPNPPYPPAQRPAFNCNSLPVPLMAAPSPCSMPPRVVSVGPPPAYMTLPPRPIVATTVVANPVVRTAPPVVFTQTPPPQQVIVTVPSHLQMVTNPGVVTYVVNQPY